jgi:hypothetical protein
MRFSLATFLVAVSLAALVVCSAWAFLMREYDVNWGASTSVGGSSFASQHSGFAIRVTGEPTFISNTAFGYGLPSLDGERLPYVFILRHDRNAEFLFESQLNDSSVETNIGLDDVNILLKHTITTTQDDHSKPPSVVEAFYIDGNPFEMADGRVFYCRIINGRLTVEQSKIEPMPKSVHESKTDQENIESILSWWRENENKFQQ